MTSRYGSLLLEPLGFRRAVPWQEYPRSFKVGGDIDAVPAVDYDHERGAGREEQCPARRPVTAVVAAFLSHERFANALSDHAHSRACRCADAREVPSRAASHLDAARALLRFGLCRGHLTSGRRGLHHAVAEEHVAAGLLGYAMAFFAIWWAWMNFTWFASAYDSDDVLYRLLVLVQLTGALILAAGIGALLEERHIEPCDDRRLRRHAPRAGRAVAALPAPTPNTAALPPIRRGGCRSPGRMDRPVLVPDAVLPGFVLLVLPNWPSRCGPTAPDHRGIHTTSPNATGC